MTFFRRTGPKMILMTFESCDELDMDRFLFMHRQDHRIIAKKLYRWIAIFLFMLIVAGINSVNFSLLIHVPF